MQFKSFFEFDLTPKICKYKSLFSASSRLFLHELVLTVQVARCQ